MKPAAQKNKPLKLILPNEIQYALLSRARKNFRSVEDEAISIIAEHVRKTPDKQLSDMEFIFQELIKRSEKNAARSNNSAKFKKNKI